MNARWALEVSSIRRDRIHATSPREHLRSERQSIERGKPRRREPVGKRRGQVAGQLSFHPGQGRLAGKFSSTIPEPIACKQSFLPRFPLDSLGGV
jgi:hypothetical protein